MALVNFGKGKTWTRTTVSTVAEAVRILEAQCKEAFDMISRLFYAVVPPESVTRAVCALQGSSTGGQRFRWEPQENLHVTLRFLGDCDENQARVALASLSGKASSCKLTVGPGTSKFGNSILYIPVSGADELAATVVDGTRHIGKPPDNRPFVGHLTLARAQRGGWNPKITEELCTTFTASKVSLFRSEQGTRGSGPRYVEIDALDLESDVSNRTIQAE